MASGPRAFAAGISIVVLVAAGILVGTMLAPSGARSLAPEGSLFEVHLQDGTVYVGDLTGDKDGYLELTEPAVVVPGDDGSGGPTGYTVVPLTKDPYGVVGPVLLSVEHVVMIGAVGANAGIEDAYLDAIQGQAPPPSPDSS